MWFFGKKKKKSKAQQPTNRKADKSANVSTSSRTSTPKRQSLVQPEGKVPLDASARQSLNAAMAAQAAGIVLQRKSAKGVKIDSELAEVMEQRRNSQYSRKDSSRKASSSSSKEVDAPRLSVHSLKSRPVVPRGSRRRPTVQRTFEGKAAEEILKSAGVDGSGFKDRVRRTQSTPARGLKPLTGDLPATSPLKMNLTLDRKREARKKSDIVIHPLSLRMKQGYEFFEHEGVTYRVRSGWRKSISASKGYDGYGLYRKKTERDWEIVRDLELKTKLLDQLKLVRRSSSRSSMHHRTSSTTAVLAATAGLAEKGGKDREAVIRSHSAVSPIRRGWSNLGSEPRKASDSKNAEEAPKEVVEQEAGVGEESKAEPQADESDSDEEEEAQGNEEEVESAPETQVEDGDQVTVEGDESDQVTVEGDESDQVTVEDSEGEEEEKNDISSIEESDGGADDEVAESSQDATESKVEVTLGGDSASNEEEEKVVEEEPVPVEASRVPESDVVFPVGKDDESVLSGKHRKHKKSKKKKKHKKRKHKKHKHKKGGPPEVMETAVPKAADPPSMDLKQRRKSVRDLAAMFEAKAQTA